MCENFVTLERRWVDLVSDPLIRTMMRADGVTEAEMLGLLRAVSERTYKPCGYAAVNDNAVRVGASLAIPSGKELPAV